MPFCATCGEPFQSQRLFDDHRVGEHGTVRRRCLTTDEMRERGWKRDDRTWRAAPASGGHPLKKENSNEPL